MALITGYSAANRVIDEGLAVTYARRRVYGEWTYGDVVVTTLRSVWAYTRTASKTYRYVGMTKAAAESCATAMRNKFQRTTKVSEWGTGGEFQDVSGGVMPMAEVVVNHVDGDMWETCITVSETDERMRVTAVSPSTLFATEDARDYDE